MQRILCRYSRGNTKEIKEYTENQLIIDKGNDQLSIFDLKDQFMGKKYTRLMGKLKSTCE